MSEVKKKIETNRASVCTKKMLFITVQKHECFGIFDVKPKNLFFVPKLFAQPWLVGHPKWPCIAQSMHAETWMDETWKPLDVHLRILQCCP